MALIASSAAAPAIPPISELSLPMIAFCTVFESSSSTTRSKGVELRQLAFAGEPQADQEKCVDDRRANDLLAERDVRSEERVHEVQRE